MTNHPRIHKTSLLYHAPTCPRTTHLPWLTCTTHERTHATCNSRPHHHQLPSYARLFTSHSAVHRDWSFSWLSMYSCTRQRGQRAPSLGNHQKQFSQKQKQLHHHTIYKLSITMFSPTLPLACKQSIAQDRLHSQRHLPNRRGQVALPLHRHRDAGTRRGRGLLVSRHLQHRHRHHRGRATLLPLMSCRTALVRESVAAVLSVSRMTRPRPALQRPSTTRTSPISPISREDATGGC